MKRFITILLIGLLATVVAQGQITIGGNVYGGGNKGEVGGSTKVVVYEGDLNKVFGGARMGNVGGNAYVNIDGENASSYIVINHVYGGNDIAGTIGTAEAVGEELPAELKPNDEGVNANGVDNTWNTYVHISSKTVTDDIKYTTEEIAAAEEGDAAYGKTTNDVKIKKGEAAPDAEKIFIGQVFAGGNGDYHYESTTSGGEVTHNIYQKKGDTTPIATTVTNEGEAGFTLPELNKTYLDIQGGTIFYAHGGGNNATVKEQDVIHVDNPSKVVTEILVNENKLEVASGGTDLLTPDRINDLMGVRLEQEHIESTDFQIGRLFGGNNLAAMAIRPTWYLQSGRIRNLYSGGNRGDMTSPVGLLLEIDPKVPDNLTLNEELAIKNKLVIDNVYGGCRMADVIPKDADNNQITVNNLSDLDENGQLKYHFPNGLAARVLVRGGDINNVYGGNDVTGRVYGGNAVDIYSSIRGDVYGGGNGAYPYTDQYALKDDPYYGDLYYGDRTVSNYTFASPTASAEALNAYRPNAEQVSIRLVGTKDNPTIIGGSVFCGGNCATLKTNLTKPMIELKMGSYVVADKVFLGNNGEKMVDEEILEKYAGNVTSGNTSYDFSQMTLTDSATFATYMEGVAMDKIPSMTFDKKDRDGADYKSYTSMIGSFFCGGNIGSMTYQGVNEMVFDAPIIIYDKVVGGCNNANVPKKYPRILDAEGNPVRDAAGNLTFDTTKPLNARYEGGILGYKGGAINEQASYLEGDVIKDRLILRFDSLKIEPRRWVDETNKINPEMNLVWNTVHKNLDESYQLVKVPYYDEDGMWFEHEDRRLYGGNVYGGCYNSGHVNGNVVININNDLVSRDEVFATRDEYGNYENRNSGVLSDVQGEDVLGSAMNVFGAGYGEDSEVWGSTTINLKKGYAFQLFGGGERGYVGKGVLGTDGKKTYSYDSKYSTYVNLCDNTTNSTITETTQGVAETEFLYGGGFDGIICGNTYVHLGNGRVIDVLGGSCNADILGHTEVYIGKNVDGSLGFPYVSGGVYAGNDLGGVIQGERDYTSVTERTVFDNTLLTANTYVEYLQGRVDSIFGGNYGYYHYADAHYKQYVHPETGEPRKATDKGFDPLVHYDFTKPFFNNAFVYFNPVKNVDNYVGAILGGSKGFANEVTNNNSMQEKSYILMDDQSGSENFKTTDVFGAGAYAGLGNVSNKGVGRSVVDLFQGHVHNVYGASNREGLVGYTRINVPSASTIHVNALFGGGKGYEIERINDPDDTEARTSTFCDTYVSCIDYQSENAFVDDALYGGNHNSRITCDTYLNIGVPVKQDNNGNFAKVYGAGYGTNTVAGRTNIFLNDGAKVNEVYGGGRDGNIYNFPSLRKWLSDQYEAGGSENPDNDVAAYGTILAQLGTYIAQDANRITLPSDIGTYVNASGVYDGTYTNDILPTQQKPVPDYHNTNVHIKEGAMVKTNAQRDADGYNGGYAYGGGYGSEATVAGTTSIELLGGTVDKDVYGAGWGAPVYDEYQLKSFTAGTNVKIEGGTCRNVYGGGYQGSVGYHEGGISASAANDILGETHVVIGRLEEDVRADSLTLASNNITKHGFYYGRPAIQRNAYAGGEGGAVYGTGNITINNGYIGYIYNAEGTDSTETTAIDERYEENITDYSWKDSEGNYIPNTNLYDSGCVFGGGYVDNSSVDYTHVNMYGGHVRNSLFGGGEVAAIGRGLITASGANNATRTLKGIYKAGKTNLEMFGGHVHRDVFGGGRGYDNLGKTGGLYSDGFVFGQTEVHIHGGEIGTEKELANMHGNVFGGGDIGYVYSAYENKNGVLCFGKKSGVRYDDGDEGYYYKYEDGGFVTEDTGSGDEKDPTEDCKVLIEPHCKVIGNSSVEFTGIFYAKDQIVSSIDLDYLKKVQPGLFTGSPPTIDANGKVTADDGITFTRSYAPGEYVPIYALNTLENKNDNNDKTKWAALDPTGIIIRNAVFAGGNTSAGSATVYANATSVFGNVTASVHDAYHRDLITLGTGHTGGLYGDGNLTLVDGYRGLNITNYGTDYYSISKEIDIDAYHALPEREAAYYELKYKCKLACTDKDGTRYTPGNETTKASTITADDLLVLFVENNGTSVRVDEDGNRVTETTGGTAVLTKDANGKWIPNPATKFWEENGVLPVYAGRLMNSIQRADFCGVFGSRMVLQGAQDRVPEIVDYTNYTINRVREVSLNQQHSTISSDLTLKSGATQAQNQEDQNPDDYADLEKAIHGNYFGIYNIVNYLGALTSDVHFKENEDIRRTSNNSNAKFKAKIKLEEESDSIAYGSAKATYYNWKRANSKNNTRNNGSSFNKVALASGVYLELTTEKSTGKELNEKDWGYITGVIELDLINVQPGIGGGFVYAKNEHRKGTYSKKQHATLTALNADAITRKDFSYTHTPANETVAVDNDLVEWETSGNFVHSTQTIIDDCYNISGRYSGNDAVPAHYWYIKGSVYVYDQYISAYTGMPNAFSQKVDIPLTITSASHGTMKLLNVMPNRYAYYSSPGKVLEDDKKVVINDISYSKNDPISYWDWYLLSKSERDLFVEKTYVTIADCKIGNKIYPEGYSMLPEDYESLKNAATTQEIDGKSVKAVQVVTKDEDDNYQVVADEYKAFDFVFRESNNLSHDTGYILTYRVNNPTEWNAWYTLKNSSTQAKNQTGGTGYEDGPTYRLKSSTGGVLGQRDYAEGELISKDIYDTYEGDGGVRSHVTASDGKQATFALAYIVTKELTVTEGEGVNQVTRHYNPGATVSESVSGYTSPAYICTSTIQLSQSEYIYLNAKMSEIERNQYISDINKQIKDLGIPEESVDNPTENQINALSAENKTKLTKLQALRQEIKDNVVPAYYCTEAGRYGGNYYESGKNYRGLEAWSSMSETDREKFIFNYDALDLLIDPTFSNSEGEKYQYDGATYDSVNDKIIPFSTEDQAKTNPAGYSVTKPVDYTATYTGTTALSYTKDDNTSGSATSGTELSRTEYERLTNEQRNYVPVTMTKVDDATNTYRAYVVNTSFQIGNSPYAVGTVLSATEYGSLSDNDKAWVTQLECTSTGSEAPIYYYCRESYKVGEHGNGVEVSAVSGITATRVTSESETPENVTKTGTYNSSSTDKVPVGFVIAPTIYSNLVTQNQQKNFTIHGISPTETSTFYVSRNSDYFDLTKEKIITAVYQYDYEEVDNNGNVTPVSERHVLNIHINFKSGVPTVEDIRAPQMIIPGDLIGLREPNVTPGAYEVVGGGWELFETKTDAESHINGIEFLPSSNPLYWYQDGYYVAYYAKTYLGKSYSNSEPVRVANYHDLKKVMDDKEHHYYVDRPDVQRDSKIYINDYTTDDPATSQNGLDLLKDFFDLSLLTAAPATSTALEGHKPLDRHVHAGRNLEFFLRTDIDHSDTGWSPIGSNNTTGDNGGCFEGTLHGDGHTLSGLDHSLFNHLCGDVYNLGVTGTFTGAGIAEEGSGYVENCWISTSSTKAKTAKPVFGTPNRTGGGIQIVNSYYQEEKEAATTEASDDPAKKMAYPTHSGSYGIPTRKSAQAFYNGEVTYDLNGFYLWKRYNDKTTTSGDEYKYYVSGVTDPETGALIPQEGRYDSNASLSSNKYVEDRYADGDYRFAVGYIPEADERQYKGENDEVNFYPIWPDDYLFFGQVLNYGYGTAQDQDHDEQPTYVLKKNGRVVDTSEGNRVYRAPAYFRSKEMGVAHYNAWANLAAKSKDGTKEAYPGMTAIDFTGYRDSDRGNEAYKSGLISAVPYDYIEGGAFYPPLLDNDGLIGLANRDETRNLLVYIPEETKEISPDNMTRTAVIDYATDPVFDDYYSWDTVDPDHKYRTVAINNASISYHVVEKVSDKPYQYQSTYDHFLVDKEEFNSPIQYTFTGGTRMWYQRMPDKYVDIDWSSTTNTTTRTTKGWEGVSLPFTAELVTTNEKGEITHFYGDSKTGHEYWLREYQGKKGETMDTFTAFCNYPNPSDDTSDKMDKTVTNTYLWDHYYKNSGRHNQKDANDDTYQTYYNNDNRFYKDYAMLTKATPYIIGFPGQRYYEFDLSGQWKAENTAKEHPVLTTETPQIITFASSPNTTIGVSDDEMTGVTKDGFVFKPNYLKETLKDGTGDATSDPACYYLNAKGDAYVTDEGEGDVIVQPFRPFFEAASTPTSGAKKRNTIRRIEFDREASTYSFEGHDPTLSDVYGALTFYVEGVVIGVKSTLTTDVPVLIVNTGGQTIASFTIHSGETIESPVPNTGVYIIRADKGRYNYKVTVK